MQRLSTDSDNNPKWHRHKTSTEAQAVISHTQHRRLQKKISATKTIQEIAKSMKVENAPLLAKMKNVNHTKNI